MPTVLRLGGLRVVVYLNDHRPTHVHVLGQGGEAVYESSCVVPKVRYGCGRCRGSVEPTEAALAAELPVLCRAWKEIHGYER